MTEKENKNDKEERETPKDEVFFQLFIDSQKSIHAYILALVHNFQDTNDILQETATVLWRRFEEFDQSTNFTAWGISIARNLVRNYFKQRRRSRIQFDDNLLDTIEEKALAQLSHNDERLDALKKCCEKMSRSNQQIIKLRYSEGLTIKAIASYLGKPIQGMYKYMARLQDSLLRCIEATMVSDRRSI